MLAECLESCLMSLIALLNFPVFQIAARPGSQHFKCLFRVAFVPRDAYDLLRKDSAAFEYFYMQVSNNGFPWFLRARDVLPSLT